MQDEAFVSRWAHLVIDGQEGFRTTFLASCLWLQEAWLPFSFWEDLACTSRRSQILSFLTLSIEVKEGPVPWQTRLRERLGEMGGTDQMTAHRRALRWELRVSIRVSI